MIVDDEALVRIGLQSIIEWEERGYRIAGVFKNGIEALEAAHKQHFDVILTDIRMPGMDGLELTERLQVIAPHVHVIILSSYNDFEYTRRAIQLGVKDYISKYEMEPEELLRVLDALDFSHASSALQAELLPAVSAASGHNLAEECCLRVICMKPAARDTDYSQAERKAMTLQAEEIFSRLKQLSYLGEQGELLFGAYVVEDESTAEAEERRQIEQVAEELMNAWAKNLNISPIVGVSERGATNQLEQLQEEANAAALCAFYTGAGLYFSDRQWKQIGEAEWLEWYKRVKNKFDYLQFEPLASALEKQLLKAEGARLYPSEWLRIGETIASQVMNLLVERYDFDAKRIQERYGTMWPLTEAVKKVQSAAELAELVRRMTAIAEEMITAYLQRSGWVQQVKDYVEKHYGEVIRLEDMADRANFSASHFSHRFRQETGEPFSDYVTRVRIREAVRMYQETNFSTEEIAARVGYTNPNYFIKVFKKETGQTVKQFKQRF